MTVSILHWVSMSILPLSHYQRCLAGDYCLILWAMTREYETHLNLQIVSHYQRLIASVYIQRTIDDQQRQKKIHKWFNDCHWTSGHWYLFESKIYIHVKEDKWSTHTRVSHFFPATSYINSIVLCSHRFHGGSLIGNERQRKKKEQAYSNNIENQGKTETILTCRFTRWQITSISINSIKMLRHFSNRRRQKTASICMMILLSKIKALFFLRLLGTNI